MGDEMKHQQGLIQRAECGGVVKERRSEPEKA
jgi:hypothetical protein